MRDHPPRTIDWNDYPDLGELVAGKTEGRTRSDQRTFFLNSTGVGAQFTCLAHFIYTQARSRVLGHEVSGELFVESIQP
jgi:ornithine cyclodeaminase/alanine dehydrogenase-like protein (mu-crystallin family)